MNRTQRITFRVTEYEEKLIIARADKTRMTKSNFIRSAVLNKPIVAIDGLPEFSTQLKRIGNNVNQLTVLLRMNRIETVNLQGIKEELQSITKSVASALQGSEAA